MAASIMSLFSALLSAIGGGGPVYAHPAIGGGGPVHASIGGGGPVHRTAYVKTVAKSGQTGIRTVVIRLG